MKLELRYENSCPSYHGDEESDDDLDWYYTQGVFDSYQELLKFTDDNCDWRMFSELYIDFPDEYSPTKEERQYMENLNKTFKKNLDEIETREKLLEDVESKKLALKLHYHNDIDVLINVYNNYYMLMKDVEHDCSYGIYDGLYIVFPDGYVPTQDEIKGLELLNKKFEIDKEQAIKF